jgi:drug/metabolite transporter (DMT)-like permease
MVGEHLPPLTLLGGASIVLGVVVSELKPKHRRARIDIGALNDPA